MVRRYLLLLLLFITFLGTSCADTVAKEQYDTTIQQLNSVQAEKDSLALEITVLKDQVTQFEKNLENSKTQITQIEAEKSSLSVLNSDLTKEASNLKVQVSSLQTDKNSLAKERDTLFKERDALTKERDALVRERDALNFDLSVLKKQLTPSPDHAASETDIWGNSEMRSISWRGREWERQQKEQEIGRVYHRMHTYIANETDCNDMAVDIWNMLLTENIKSVIAIGNLEIKRAKFADCNHAWLLIFNSEGKYSVLEPTSGEVFYKGTMAEGYLGYSFLYTKPSALWSDLKKKW